MTVCRVAGGRTNNMRNAWPIAADNIISDFVSITHIHTSKLTLQRSHLPPATGRPFIQHAIRCNSMRFVVNFQFNCNIFECLWNCYALPHKYALVVCVVATYVACVAGIVHLAATRVKLTTLVFCLLTCRSVSVTVILFYLSLTLYSWVLVVCCLDCCIYSQ